MPLDFGQNRSDSGSSKRGSGRKPPPNYLSRRVQWRLFMLLGTLMLVILLMNVAKNPKHYRWMRFKDSPDKTGPSDKSNSGQVKIDTRLERPSRPDYGDPIGTVRTVDVIQLPIIETPVESDESAEQLAYRDGWMNLLETLSSEDRKMLGLVLFQLRKTQVLSDDQKETWPGVIERMDQAWSSYLANARNSISSDEKLSGQEKDQWVAVLTNLESTWLDKERPALTSILEVSSEKSASTSLPQLQAILDRVAMSAIEDNTFIKSVDRDAWFRLFERLQGMDPAELDSLSLGKKSFFQLFQNSEEYRGKIVTVSGSIRLVTHVKATNNDFGIAGYYIYWIKPEDEDSPIVIYALEKPSGFPGIPSQEAAENSTEFYEEAEFTGFYFKRLAYQSKQDLNLAPLIVARTARWQPQVVSLAARAEDSDSPLFKAGVIIIVLLGVLFTAAVYYQNRWTRGSVVTSGHMKQKKPNLQKMNRIEVTPSIAQSLEILSQEDRESSEKGEKR